MSKCCTECGYHIENPYHSISAVLRDPATGRLAFSNRGEALCNTDTRKVLQFALANASKLDSILGFAIEGTTGACGGFTGSVQISSGVSDGHGDFRFYNPEVIQRELPRAAAIPYAKSGWMQKDDEGEWTSAEWAEEIYRRITTNKNPTANNENPSGLQKNSNGEGLANVIEEISRRVIAKMGDSSSQ